MHGQDHYTVTVFKLFFVKTWFICTLFFFDWIFIYLFRQKIINGSFLKIKQNITVILSVFHQSTSLFWKMGNTLGNTDNTNGFDQKYNFSLIVITPEWNETLTVQKRNITAS